MLFALILAAQLTQPTQQSNFDALKKEAVAEELALSDEDKSALIKLKTKLYMTTLMQCSNMLVFNGKPFSFDAIIEIRINNKVGTITTKSSDDASKCIARAMSKVKLRPAPKLPNYLYINVDSKLNSVGSNNSFKPNPLRSSNARSGFMSGSA